MIDNVQLKLRQTNERSLAAEVHLRARKLFLSASIRVTGQLDLDDQLNLKISDLNCTGDGGNGDSCVRHPHALPAENRRPRISTDIVAVGENPSAQCSAKRRRQSNPHRRVRFGRLIAIASSRVAQTTRDLPKSD